jgi:YVTN family beta-propeller protein
MRDRSPRPIRYALGLLIVLLAFAGTAFAQDRYRVYVANEFSADISVIDSATNEVIGTISISGRPGEVRPRGMAVSPDGTIIYASISDFNPVLETPEDKILAIDVRTNEIIAEFRAGGNPERLAINPDGTQVWAALEATAQGAGYDIATGERLGVFRVGVEAEGVAVSPDGRWVYITAEATHTVTVIDAIELRVVKHFLVGNRPREVDFSLDGRFAYVSAEIGGTISVVDVENNHTVIESINLGLDSRPVEMAVDPTRPRLYVAGGGTSSVYVIDTDTNQLIATVREQMGRRPWGIAVTPDGKLIYTADGLSDSSTVIDAETLQVVTKVQVGRGAHSVEIGVIPGGN